MNKADPPRTFGVFKPAGHTVLVFPDLKMLEETQLHLAAAGIRTADVTRYSPAEMMEQTAADLEGAGALASVGQDLNLVKVQRELASQGCHFMVVPTSKDALARQVADIARPLGAVAAQYYGTLIVEDLIDAADGKYQVFESPDRGLDTNLPAQPD